MSAATRLSEPERLRLLGLMGVDVYVPRPRGVPVRMSTDSQAVSVANAAQPNKVHRAAPSAGVPMREVAAARGPARVARTPRIRVRCPDAARAPRLLQSVLRAAGIGEGEWVMEGNSEVGELPLWSFGGVSAALDSTPVLRLPALADLQHSASERRRAWPTLRACRRCA